MSEQERHQNGNLLRDFWHTAQVMGEYLLYGLQDALIAVDDNLAEFSDE